MSTDYGIRCECGVCWWPDDWRTPGDVAALLEHRAEFEAAHRLLESLPDGAQWRLTFSDPLRGLAEFMARHSSHAMRVFDEYGEPWPRPSLPPYDPKGLLLK